MSEKMPEKDWKTSPSEAPVERMRTITEAELLKEGAGYDVTHEGDRYEKRLNVTEKQIESARHEMVKDLERQGKLNEFLDKIGVESLEGLPVYHLLNSLPPEEAGISDREATCCAFEVGSDELRSKILDAFYEKYPAVKSQPIFILASEAYFIVRDKKVDKIPRELVPNHF